MKRRRLVIASAIAAASLFAGTATAQAPAATTYPSKPVRIVVPFAPGASTDILSRLAADELSRRLGQPFVVENIGGAGGTIGTAQVVNAKPDGYTLVAATPGPITVSPVAQKGLSYDVNQLRAITLIAEGPGGLVVARNSPFKSVADLLTAARARPGALSFGSAGTGAFSHLASELLKTLAGIDVVHVPYKGSGPAMVDVLGGRLDFYIEFFPAVAKLVDSGELRALAVTSGKRFPLRPDIPTMIEAGVPGYDASAWVGLMAPAATPKDIIDKLQQALAQSLRDPAIVAKINGMGVVPGGQPPAEFARFMSDERDKYRKLVETTGLAINNQ
jgi:tripartite-type tricarboxylate transporter receptor subunit TctC